MRNLVTALLLLALLIMPAVLSGCGGGGGGGSTSMSLSGYVVDNGTRAQIYGATVTADNQTTSTGNNSNFFALTGLTHSPVTLVIQKTGYQDFSESVTISGGAMSLGTLGLVPLHTAGMGDVTGYVTLNSFPAVGATVTTMTLSGSAKTDSSGAFTMYNIPPGTVTLQASLNGTSFGYAQVTVVADAPPVSAGTIQLSSGPPPPPI